MFLIGKKQVAAGTPQLNTMADGSCSWEQPDSKGFGGSEGFCGQTAVANMLSIYERTRAATPHAVSRASGDITPGSKPATLMKAIAKLSRTPARYSIHYDKRLPNATPKKPLICLMYWGGTGYHYVLVVRVTATHVVINHWGMQMTYTRAVFEKYWAFRGAGIGGGSIAVVGGLKPNTSIRYK